MIIRLFISRMISMSVLLCIITAFVFSWSLIDDGMSVDTKTGVITSVETGKIAHRNGLREGDVIRYINNRPFDDYLLSMIMSDMLTGKVVVYEVMKDDISKKISISYSNPSIGFQSAKIAILILSLLCWYIGFTFGISQVQKLKHNIIISIYWSSLSLIIGLYIIAKYASFPMGFVLQWILLCVFVPLSPYIHSFFPYDHYINQKIKKGSYYFFLLSFFGINAILIRKYIYGESILDISYDVSLATVILFALSIMMSLIMLYANARMLQYAHHVRQAKIIMSSYGILLCFWVAVVFTRGVLNVDSDISRFMIIIVSYIVPIGFIISGKISNLRSVLKLLQSGIRYVSSLLLSLMMFLLFVKYTKLSVASDTVLFTSMLSSIIPLSLLLDYIVRSVITFFRRNKDNDYHATITSVASSLDTHHISSSICEFIARTYKSSLICMFLLDTESNVFVRRFTVHLGSLLPEYIPYQKSNIGVAFDGNILEMRDIASSAEMIFPQSVILDPSITLCCLIRGESRQAIGMIFLGMRGDGEPYHREDKMVLDNICHIASLALRNSYAYMLINEQRTALQSLFTAVEQAEHVTSAALAQELHDEVINVNLRSNIASIELMLAENNNIDPWVRGELASVLNSEQTTIEMLRTICTRIHPSGLDDIYGLPSVLRLITDQIRFMFRGQIHLEIHNFHVPLSPDIQFAVSRIAREAVLNAIQHSYAQDIYIRLSAKDNVATLIVQDTGPALTPIIKKRGHLGIQGMIERTHRINGTIDFRSVPHNGTTVCLQFPCVDDNVQRSIDSLPFSMAAVGE